MPAPVGALARVRKAANSLPSAARRTRSAWSSGAAGDRLDRRLAVEIEAHGRPPSLGIRSVAPPVVRGHARAALDPTARIGRMLAPGSAASAEPSAPPARPLVVQKFGGSSVGDADRIRRVARRIARERNAGADLVVVVSAMGDTTDELLALAAAITDEPDSRELDMLLATGEHQSATLVSMALHALGRAGDQPDRRPGRDQHRRPPRPGPDRQRRPAPGAPGAGRRPGRDRGRLPGREPGQPRGGRDHDARPGRLGHDGRGPRRPPRGRPLPGLHRRPRDLHCRSADRARRPAAAGDRLRGDARARPPGRPGDAGPGGRAGLGQRRRHRGPQLVRGCAGHPDQGGSVRGAAQQGSRPGPRPERGQGHPGRGARPAGRRPPDLRARWPTPGSTST